MNKSNLYFMTGDDPFSLREEVQRWKQGFLEKFGDTDLEELDGETATLEQIAQATQTTHFLSENRLVILKDFLSSQRLKRPSSFFLCSKKYPKARCWF